MSSSTAAPRAPVVVVAGKNPVAAPGGYAAYSRNLCAVLCDLGRAVHVVALGDRDESLATDVGQLHLVRNELAARVPFIADVQMTALPLYSRSFARRIDAIVGEGPNVIWGVGPWALGGALRARDRREAPGSTFIASYFTTFMHEMRGSLSALRVRDYGLRRKLQYAGVVGVLGPVFREMERLVLTRADRIVTHYQSSEDLLSAEFGLPRDRFHRMTYYTEVFDRQAPAPLPAELPRPLVLAVSRQDPRKGINFLLRAMARLAARGVEAHCLLVGGGSMLRANQRLAARLGLDRRVTFAGFVGDVRPLLETADVFVCPAVEEGAGSLSVLEAMSVGAPTVATAIDGLPEDIEDGESGLLVPSRDPEALAGAMERLLRDRPLAERLGRGARAADRSQVQHGGDADRRGDPAAHARRVARGGRLPETTACRMCGGNNLYTFLDLGSTPPADQFLRQDQLREPETFYPLQVRMCEDCGLAQLGYTVDPEVAVLARLSLRGVDHAGRARALGASSPGPRRPRARPRAGPARRGFRQQCRRAAGGCSPTRRARARNRPGAEHRGEGRARGIDTVCRLRRDAGRRGEIVEVKGQASVVTGTNVFAHVGDLAALMEAVDALLLRAAS